MVDTKNTTREGGQGVPAGMIEIGDDLDAPVRNGAPCWLWHRLWGGPMIGYYSAENAWWRTVTGDLTAAGDVDLDKCWGVGIFPSHWCALGNIPPGHKVEGWGWTPADATTSSLASVGGNRG